jgi:glycosyltransferase involved in cell wall biosynthesis
VHNIADCKLNIISTTQSGDYFNSLRDYIYANHLDDRIKMLGPKNPMEIAEELKVCLALCLPSVYESFGMVLAEAMAMGKPVIASNVGGIPYLVKDGYNGFLIEPGNIEQMVEKITFLMANKKIAAEMGQNGRNEALKRWHPDKIAEKTMDVYKKVLTGWAKPPKKHMKSVQAV